MTVTCCRNALWALLVSCVLALTVACGGSASPEAQPAEAQTPEAQPSEVQPSEVSAAIDSEPIRVNIDEIFPPGPGRDLVLDNCQSCHVWVPIVILQMDKAAWYRNGLEHRDRVEGLSDEEFKILYDYLSSTFTPDRPVAKLPAALLETWTSY